MFLFYFLKWWEKEDIKLLCKKERVVWKIFGVFMGFEDCFVFLVSYVVVDIFLCI